MEARFARYDEVCIEKLRVIHVDKDKIVGVLYSGAELKELRDHLYQLNFWFSTRNVEKYSETKDSIHWVLPKLQGAPPQGVSLDDHAPFIINRVVNKDCRRGRAYWKRKNSVPVKEEVIIEVDEPPKKKRKEYGTIKNDCPARMSIRTIKAFPDFAVRPESSKKIKSKFAKLLKQAIKRGDVKGEERFVVAISRGGHHQNHLNEVDEERSLPVHPEIVEYITKLVTEENVNSPKTIKSLVAEFVRENFSLSEASSGNRCYYPMIKDIRTILRGIMCNVTPRKIKVEHVTNPEVECVITTKTEVLDDDLLNEDESEHQVISLTEGYLTLHFMKESPDEMDVSTHFVSAPEVETQLSVTPVIDEEEESLHVQINEDRASLMSALEEVVNLAAEADNRIAIQEAYEYVKRAAFLLQTSLDGNR
ncbi:uncharacterized protein [Penaeus vannamei]|nr:uncharacterized protein LOC113803858 [Penaeus vannamei]